MTKKTNKIIVLILNAYSEYVSNHYPKDPNIYVIRAHPITASKLLAMSETVVNAKGFDKNSLEEKFMNFKVEKDLRLKEEELVFGPETITINWTDK